MAVLSKVFFDEVLWLGALAEFAEATVEEEVGEEDGGGADDVGESLTISSISEQVSNIPATIGRPYSWQS